MGDPARLRLAATMIDVVENEQLLESANVTGQMLINGLNQIAVRFTVYEQSAKHFNAGKTQRQGAQRAWRWSFCIIGCAYNCTSRQYL
jgi:hypothetical protein